LPKLRVNWQTAVLCVIVVALVLTRLWDLGNRAYSHDESTHAWESWKLITGQGYRHDPVYHGPLLYHLTGFVFVLLGVDDASARVASALFAVLAVLLVWPLRRWLGRTGALAAMFLLTISPTMMFRGRFIRHDIFVIAPAMAMVVGFFRYLQEREAKWLYLIAGALSLTFSGKAVGYVYGLIFGSFWLLCLLVQKVRARGSVRDSPAFDLVILLGTLALPMLSHIPVQLLGSSPFEYGPGLFRELPPGPVWLRARVIILAMVGLSALVGLWWKRRVWLAAAGIYYAVFALLHTTMLTNAGGIESGLLGQLGYWLSQQSEARGGQPWYYFFFLLAVYELLPWLLAALSVLHFSVVRAKEMRERHALNHTASNQDESSNTMLPFVIYWTLMTFAVWTWASEKMPWQTMHLVLPLGILAGWYVGQVWQTTDWRKLLSRGAAHVSVLIPLALFLLWVLLNTTFGSARPFAGLALDQLRSTLRWVLSTGLLLVALAFLYRYVRALGRSGLSRAVLLMVCMLGLLVTVRTGWMLTFVNQNYATEFLVFAAASPDTALATAELDEIERRLGSSQPLSVAYDNESQQPFFWYLRDRDHVSFFTGTSGLTGDPHVVIIGPDNESKLKSQLLGKYTRRDYRLIWWPDESVYRNLTLSKLWQDLKDPARRKYWWDILWFRKYPQSTTAWPLVHKFAMYVRKDLSAQTWVLGPGISEPAIELPEDEYEKQRRDLAAVATWGSYGEGAGQFNYPKGIAVDGRGRVVVADSYNHRVQVFDKDGGFVRQWGGAGSAPGLFQEPWGIAVDEAGRIYVADTWNHRIQVFDSEGGFLRQWGFFGDTSGTLGGPTQFYGPRDVAVDHAGNVLVSDTGNKRVLKFTSEGQFLQQIGGAGSLNGQFREPVGLATDVDGNVYVADTWNHRIQKLDANLSYLSEWPVVGWEGEGVTNKPYLASDRDGNVYASAPDVHWVTSFSSTGAVRAVWGKYGADLNSMNMPTGVATDAAGNVYVLDSANHRVLKFAPLR